MRFGVYQIRHLESGKSGMFGEKNPNSKLTDAQRREIYRLGKLGISQRKRAKMFGVSKFPIQRIDQDDRWAL